MNKACVCLGGYNVFIDFDLKSKVQHSIMQSIEDGYKLFLCGGFGNWALFFASELRLIQKNGRDISIVCYIPYINNAEQYRRELVDLAVYDEVHILPKRNLLETDLFLIKKGQRIFIPNSCGIKNELILRALEKTSKEVIFI